MSGEFDAALRGATATLRTSDGASRPLPGRRWSAAPEAADRHVLASCTGPVLDIGCGPGRLTEALTRAGVPCLGIDSSPLAVAMTVRRGAMALRRDVFGPLPGEGGWGEALLIDGNIGIGGDPRALLGRVRRLLRPGGAAWVEVEPPGTGIWCGTAVVDAAGPGRSFGWARVGAEAIAGLAPGFVPRVIAVGGRWFAELRSTS
ncbi:class I SAM-dependent methyltransferase [Saccharopolyspora sp. TS4A08]|uniref:Class I SAM-dependent methyltransferase n=1 Tax=Saccharopolyspora ipomoeae TaxID=3042027 RepID=A0ABT6PUX5_9PSEU|nr:class I SAM-dependent methyltransferase [Saccharopolyspora sp. TS4A08]MDI2031817.1 class I SAM-dependent methyltransferase [Saccharopolyspora sp. TS4A08]